MQIFFCNFVGMIVFVNAKINLGLRVVRRRSDGYHDLETIFLPVGKGCGTPGHPGTLCDILELTEGSSDHLVTLGNEVGCSVEDNLVWRALQVMRREYKQLAPMSLVIEKHLPHGAGMGGGSADAAFTLKALNEWAGNPIDPERLKQMALELGADVPFFLVNEPSYATGVGDCLTPIEIPALAGKWLAVVKPEQGISTREAFGHVSPHVSEIALTEAVRAPIDRWHELIINDFERSMFAIHPGLASLKDYLYESGALYASMTGSGSAFYGIYNDEEQARRAAEYARVPFATFVRL